MGTRCGIGRPSGLDVRTTGRSGPAAALWRAAVLAALLLPWLAPLPAQADGRVALVVGNGAYTQTGTLANPVNDARAVGAALNRIGFDATVLEDLDRNKMGDALRQFEEDSDGADMALLFYAGHGMEMDGANYLIPVDARLASASAVGLETIQLDLVLGMMENAKMRIVILDACRNNPFVRSWRRAERGNVRSDGGLADVARGEGLLVAYAAAPGRVAADGDGSENSPYTTVLLKHLERPGVEIIHMFRDVGVEVGSLTTGDQQPFVSFSALSGNHYLVGDNSDATDTAGPNDAVVAARLQQETVFWESVTDSTNAADFDLYLRAYPNGRFADLARNRLAALPGPAPDPPRPGRPAPTRPDPTPARPRAGEVFRDCDTCPEMAVIPAGTFRMGSLASEQNRRDTEGPQRRVTLRSFALGLTEVTFDEWEACVRGGGCGGYRPGDQGWGRGARPVISVSWGDARAYVSWLSAETGAVYRLPSESEWEYAARAGTTTPFHAGATISTDQANYDGNYVYGSGRRGTYRGRTTPVGTFAPNTFGLYDVHGNVWEWVEDCWHGSYREAPSDGRAWTVGGDCGRRVLRGGSWSVDPRDLRSAARIGITTGVRDINAGFRVARTLD